MLPQSHDTMWADDNCQHDSFIFKKIKNPSLPAVWGQLWTQMASSRSVKSRARSIKTTDQLGHLRGASSANPGHCKDKLNHINRKQHLHIKQNYQHALKMNLLFFSILIRLGQSLRHDNTNTGLHACLLRQMYVQGRGVSAKEGLLHLFTNHLSVQME